MQEKHRLPDYILALQNREDMIVLGQQKREHSFLHYQAERRLDCHYYFDPVSKHLVGGVHWGPDAEGPPGCGHGGSIATVMDDGMGTCAWASGHRVVALNLNVDFKNFVPLGSMPKIDFWVERTEGRKVFARGTLTAEDGTLHAESTGLFLEIDFEKLLDKQSAGPVG